MNPTVNGTGCPWRDIRAAGTSHPTGSVSVLAGTDAAALLKALEQFDDGAIAVLDTAATPVHNRFDVS